MCAWIVYVRVDRVCACGAFVMGRAHPKVLLVVAERDVHIEVSEETNLRPEGQRLWECVSV